MRKLTLDNNCLCDLEENRPSAPDVRKLIKANDNGVVRVRLVGISASEKKRDSTSAPSFDEFRLRVKELGIDHLRILKPMKVWDLTYWDWSLRADNQMVDLARNIHGILFPGSPYEYDADGEKSENDKQVRQRRMKWRNRRCDVLGMWSHIHHGGDAFITRDKNFHKKTKKPKLIALGARQIMTPKEAVECLGL